MGFELGATVLRSAMLTAIALPMSLALASSWRRSTSRSSALWFAIPALFPEMLTAYAFRCVAVWPLPWREGIGGAVLLARLVPLGAMAAWMLPPPDVSESAVAASRLLSRGRNGTFPVLWRQLTIRRMFRQATFPALLLFFTAFHDFDVAALLQLPSWTDQLFVDQAGGQPLHITWQRAIGPAVVVAVLVGVGWMFGRPRPGIRYEAAAEPSPRRMPEFVGMLLGWVCCLAPLIAGPGAAWATEFVDGAAPLWQSSVRRMGLLREIGWASLYALASTALAAGMLELSTASPSPLASTGSVSMWNRVVRLLAPIARIVAVLGMAAGLTGSLTVGLTGLAWFQQPMWNGWYNTPLPLVIGQTVWLLPRAAILNYGFHELRNDSARHLAAMLGRHPQSIVRRAGRSMEWMISGRLRAIAFGALWFAAYSELTLAGLLTPTSTPSGLVRLYNFMHYGRTASLTAEATMFFALPLVVWMLVYAAFSRIGRP